MKPIIISIGAFSPLQALDSLQGNHHVVVYEPRGDICEGYSKIEMPDFEWYQCAVSGIEGRMIFHQHEGSSTILPVTNCPFVIDDEYEVDVVAMSDVLSPYPVVHRMSMNCEGSEISIIMETPIELLARCKSIDVEFHKFCDYLSITNEDVQRCVSKMEKRFICNIADPIPPFITFKRK